MQIAEAAKFQRHIYGISNSNLVRVLCGIAGVIENLVSVSRQLFT